jgi:hypothetical protein
MTPANKRKLIDQKAYDQAFEFLLGFLSPAFVFFVIITTVNLTLHPKSISDGVAITYLALLSGIYYFLKRIHF